MIAAVAQARLTTSAFARELLRRGYLGSGPGGSMLERDAAAAAAPIEQGEAEGRELWRRVTRAAMRRVPASAILSCSVAAFEAQDWMGGRSASSANPSLTFSFF